MTRTIGFTVIALALIAILGLGVYVNSLNNEFVWDDNFVVRDNAFIKSWVHLGKIFTTDFGAGSGIKFNCYRPFNTLTFLINYSMCKLDVAGYHITNVMLHILAGMMLYWLFLLILKDRFASFFGALFFVVHPVHTEAVTYIFGRSDPLSALFLFLSIIFYIKSLQTKKVFPYVISLLAFISALLSRETAIIFPFIILLYHYSFKEKLEIKNIIPPLVITIIYIAVRMNILGFFLLKEQSWIMYFKRIPGFFAGVFNYIYLLLLPLDLHIDYGTHLFDFYDIRVILGLLITGLFLYGAFKTRKKRGIITFSLLWFFLALAPVSGIYSSVFYMAEHWLYIPSVGFFLILSYLFMSLYKNRKLKIPLVCVAVFLIGSSSMLTVKQNYYWKDPITLFKRALKYTPDNARLHNNIGSVYYELKRKIEAEKHFKEAIRFNPSMAEAYYNLGNIFRDAGKRKEAILLYNKAIELKPNHAAAYNNLGIIYAGLGFDDKAAALFKKAISINPYLLSPYLNLRLITTEDTQL